jgi:hypothetical protein
MVHIGRPDESLVRVVVARSSKPRSLFSESRSTYDVLAALQAAGPFVTKQVKARPPSG